MLLLFIFRNGRTTLTAISILERESRIVGLIDFATIRRLALFQGFSDFIEHIGNIIVSILIIIPIGTILQKCQKIYNLLNPIRRDFLKTLSFYRSTHLIYNCIDYYYCKYIKNIYIYK